MDDDFDVEYIVKPEKPTLEDKLEWFYGKSLLFRIFFGRPDTNFIIQGIRGLFYALMFWFLILCFLRLLSFMFVW